VDGRGLIAFPIAGTQAFLIAKGWLSEATDLPETMDLHPDQESSHPANPRPAHRTAPSTQTP
jgi:hypothetical protein